MRPESIESRSCEIRFWTFHVKTEGARISTVRTGNVISTAQLILGFTFFFLHLGQLYLAMAAVLFEKLT